MRLLFLPEMVVYFDINARNLDIKHKENKTFTKKVITCKNLVSSIFFILEKILILYLDFLDIFFPMQQIDIREGFYSSIV